MNKLGLLLFPMVLWIASCDRAEPSAAPPSAAASGLVSSGSASRLRVDPNLLESKRITTAEVGPRSVRDEVLASGEIVPSVEGEARLGAMVSGRIAKVLVRAGDIVKDGQVLAWIDAPEAARMRGDFLRARARTWLAQKRLEQEQLLWKDKATSERALREAEAEARLANADESAVRGMLASAHVPAPQDDARHAAARIGITSPIAGVVSKRYAVVGAHVSVEDSLFEIIDPQKLIVRADVPEIAARRVQPGAGALVLSRGTDEGCRGKVRSKLEAIEPIKRTMGVVVELEPGCKGLVAGGFADVTLSLTASGGAQKIVVPRVAVVNIDGAFSVFVHKSEAGRGVFEIRSVQLGLSDGDNIVIEEGLLSGERIAVVGAFLLKGERMKAELGGE